MPGRGLVAVVVALLASAGCGAGDEQAGPPDPGTGPPSTTEPAAAPPVVAEDAPVLPVTVTDAGGDEVVVDSVERIVVVTGDVAEVVFALGLGDNVVATDVSATYPSAADALPSLGYQRTLSAEPILGYEPTVVIGTTLAGPAATFDSLRATATPVVLVDEPMGLDGPATKIRAVADALGVPGRGEVLARQVEAALADAAALADEATSAPRVAALYLRGERVQQVFGAGSGIDALLAAAGAVDVGVELGIDEIAPIGEEAMVVAAPDVIVLTTTGLESVGGIDGLLATLPAIARTPAGQDRRILAYDDQLLLGGGPRSGEALAALVADLHPELRPELPERN